MMSRATGSPVLRYGDVSILLKVVAARRDGCVQQKHLLPVQSKKPANIPKLSYVIDDKSSKAHLTRFIGG
jgi:hypothetical protein